MEALHHALLLIGPTGSGKTPLGDLLAARGLSGKRCIHFDFGLELREIAGAESLPRGFDAEERDFLREALAAGKMLERDRFPLAGKILRRFLEANRAAAGEVVILNGFPRHCAQAEYAARLVNVRRLVVLECGEDTVRERIRLNSGGDRACRTDDDPALVAQKFAEFRARTLELADYYGARGAAVITLPVEADSTGEMLYGILLEALAPAGVSS